METMGVMRQLPRYVCHKKVWALKIKEIKRERACASSEANIICGEPESAHTREAAKCDVGMDHNFVSSTWDAESGIIVPEDEGYAEFPVSREYMMKHNPQPGGYYVVYDDGYKSYSPAKAFEEGYTKI